MHGIRYSLRQCLTKWETVQQCCKSTAVRHLSAQAMPVPTPDNAPKTYPPKIEKIVSEIAGLTLIEVSELSELLKTRLNLPDAPVMPAGGFMAMPGGVTAGAAPVEEEEEKTTKNTFTVKMNKFDEKQKVALIKGIKSCLEGMNLVQAKKFVESCPVTVKADCDKEEAEKLKKELSALGAEIVLE